VAFIHERHDPLFGGHSPAPNLSALRTLSTQLVEGKYDLGLATDGDADRIAIVDEKGNYISTNDLLQLVYWYLHEVRGERGGIVRNLATTHLLDRMAKAFGEKSIEVPVGFKHVAAAMVGGVLAIPLAAPTIASARIIARYIFANLFDVEWTPVSAIQPLPPPKSYWWQRNNSKE
jgi:phosphomannomutase